jgi:hypothetical protein
MKTTKSKLPNDYAKAKFIEFLNERSLYDKYLQEVMWSFRPMSMETLDAYWKEWAEQHSQYNWIDDVETTNKCSYWESVNLEWYRELDILNEEYAKSLECVD